MARKKDEGGPEAGARKDVFDNDIVAWHVTQVAKPLLETPGTEIVERAG